MDAMTLKMDAQYKELRSNAKKTKPDLDDNDTPMSHEEEAKFMQTFLDVIDEILEEDFDALLDEGSKISIPSKEPFSKKKYLLNLMSS
nr:hypothetical protein [Tanacetum cinerariifolium]